ncbi:hypothetical protein [Pontibacter chitinilyticus]|uniref:hypothetical protein n=1 Tax=Pontibacter chitinilyticus TaxID=2674989 RepID=UPI003218E90F
MRKQLLADACFSLVSANEPMLMKSSSESCLWLGLLGSSRFQDRRANDDGLSNKRITGRAYKP